MVVPLTQTITTVTPVEGLVTLTPNDRRNIYKLLDQAGEITLNIDDTNAEVGDQVVIIITRSAGEDVELNLIFGENIVLTICGHDNDSYELRSPTYVIDLYYDGSHFVNTLDLG